MNPLGELLLCHVTDASFWDIPKGGSDPGETTLQTALRETVEETGLAFTPADLHELGHFAYRPIKDLHLYATLLERVDTDLVIAAPAFATVSAACVRRWTALPGYRSPPCRDAAPSEWPSC